MALSTRAQNALVAALAGAAVAASGFAFWSVNRTHPSMEEAAGTPPPVAITTEEDAANTGAAGREDATDSATGDSATASAADKANQPAAEATVRQWLNAWSDEASLIVVGDGFSNLPSQWVQLWADMVGNDRPVTIHHWGEAADVSFNAPIQLSDGDGEPLTVWSASRDGTTIHDAAEDYQRFVDASTPPDAVLVSMGLDSRNEDIAQGLDLLITQIDDEDEDVPVLIAIGPEGLYDEGVGDALLAWAEDHSSRVAVLDLRGEAPDGASAEQWATAFQRALDES